MQPKKSWFIEQRAVQLAIVHLTRRDDLLVTQPQVDNALDILVEICQNKQPTGRMFGVQMKAVTHLTIINDNSLGLHEIKIIPPITTTLDDLPFPLCLFVFEMANDMGYYRWLNQPIITHKVPKLMLNRQNIFKVLTKEALDELVAEVSLWYEQRLNYASEIPSVYATA